jgi:hypothetical protein
MSIFQSHIFFTARNLPFTKYLSRHLPALGVFEKAEVRSRGNCEK